MPNPALNTPVSAAPVRGKHVPKHRGESPKVVRKGVKNAAVMSGVAVAATSLAVSTGVLTKDGKSLDGAAVALSGATPDKQFTVADLAEREQSVSRSSGDRRPTSDAAKTATLDDSKGAAVTRTEDLSSADPRSLARALMPQAGLSSGEFDCLDRIWTQESGWNVHADNPSSSAYGIPQALPGSKMASAGPDWEHNPITQIKWGLGYIKSRYGTACSAWSFKAGHGWY